jgi:ATP-dependent DNA helicase RecG
VENIEEEHSTRNTRLMRMMEDMHIVENRGSGIKAMLHVMREANLEPPAFNDRRTSFWVTFRNHTLMNPDAVSWLNQFAAISLTDRQRLALVYLRQHQQISNGDYRRLNRVGPTLAGQELRGLVDADVIDQEGVGRWTRYRLKVSPALPEQRKPQTDEDRIVEHVRAVGSITNTECRALLGVDDTRAYYLLKKLCDAGRLKPEGKGKWRQYVLP